MARFDFDDLFRNLSDMQDPERNTIPDGEVIEANRLLRNGIVRRLVFLAAFAIIVSILTQSMVITLPNQFVAVKQFGEIKRITETAGVSFRIPFIQTTSVIPKDVRHYDMEMSDVITQDKKSMVADSFVLWRVVDPYRFIREASGSITQAESFVNVNTYNSMKNVISRLPQSDIISGRDTLAHQIFSELGNALDSYGVGMVAIETKHLDLPDDNKNAVYDRMISERNNIAAQYTAEGDEEARMIRNLTDMTVNILISNATAQAAESIAEGERQYMEILSQAYREADKAEFYSFVRALDAAKVSLRRGNNTLILGKDSPIAKIFYDD
ncbi:MAG: protease modulator HflC [Clostridiales bacterium]|nr:protease modulator HflC [Clostridiales bacterium]